MAGSKDVVEFDAMILEVLPNGICKVKLLKNDKIITAYLKGIFKEKKIKVYPQEKVKVEYSVYDAEKGRISFKYRNEAYGNRDPNAKKSFSSRKIRDRRH